MTHMCIVGRIISIGSRNGLSPFSAKPFLQTMLTFHTRTVTKIILVVYYSSSKLLGLYPRFALRQMVSKVG